MTDLFGDAGQGGGHTSGSQPHGHGGTHRRGFVRRHRGWFIAFTALVVVLVLGVGGFAWMLNKSVSDMPRVPVHVDPTTRPSPEETNGENILLLGADAGTERNGPGTSIIKDAASSHWPTGKYRSDATMLLHISEDRERSYLISIPRDSYVPIYDRTGQKRQRDKINSALSLYGPSGALATVENFTGLRIDHLAMVDWDGFQDITDSLGGVTVSVQGAGEIDLDGERALDYVRERKNLPEGDFDRARRQQNFLRAVLSKMVSKGTLTNPVKLRNTVKSVTEHMAVDEDWGTGDIRSLAWKMRHTKTSDVTFVTIPIDGTEEDPDAGSIDIVDEDGTEELFDALGRDDLDGFLSDYPDTRLGEPTEVH